MSCHFFLTALSATHQVISIDCLHGAPKPTIVLLHEERHCRLIKTYSVELRDKSLRPGPWSQADVGPQCQMVTAIPGDPLAALAIGDVSIAYYRSGESKVAPIAPAAMSAFSIVDDGRVLLGGRRDDKGLLSMLVLGRGEDGKVGSLEVEDLGPCSVPSTLAYLDEGVSSFLPSFLGLFSPSSVFSFWFCAVFCLSFALTHTRLLCSLLIS